MKGEWLRAFGFFFVLTFLALLAWAALPRLLGAASGAEGELLTLIKSQEREGLVFQVPGLKNELRGASAHFDRISITVSRDGQTAEAVATLDFRGGLGATKVSSLGYEKIRFVRKERTWQVDGQLAPRLVGIVRALERRRGALESGDRGALSKLTRPDAGMPEELLQMLGYADRRYIARAWYIRSERDEVLITEDATVKGTTPERPVHEDLTRRLNLHAAPGGEFFFPSGLL